MQTSILMRKCCNYLQDSSSLDHEAVPMTLKEDTSKHVSYASIDMSIDTENTMMLYHLSINLPTLEERSPVSRIAV